MNKPSRATGNPEADPLRPLPPGNGPLSQFSSNEPKVSFPPSSLVEDKCEALERSAPRPGGSPTFAPRLCSSEHGDAARAQS